jgi:hypothetical protein
MPVSPAPINEGQLRQLLAERSDPARHRPAPQERIAARIRRARMKRAAGAGLLAVAVAAGVVSGVTLAHEHALGRAPSYSGPTLPARFTTSDGAAYRRLAITAMTEPAQHSASLTVTVGSEPVDVMGACATPASGATLEVRINGTLAGIIQCQQPQPIAVSVPPGRKAVITFVPYGGSSFSLPDVHASWKLAAYAWTPPATAGAAPAEPRLPQSYTGPNTTTGHGTAVRHLIESRSGDWPADRTATFHLTYRGRDLDVSVFCAGLIGSRLLVTIEIHGGSTTMPCETWSPRYLARDYSVLNRQNGTFVTLTLSIKAPSPDTAAAYAKRPASWTIAVYEEQ